MLENALAIASRITPLVVFIDDLHWADAATLRVFLNVAHRAETMRLHLLGACRTDGLRSSRLLSDMLAGLLGQRSCGRMVLGALGDDDISRYLSVTLGAEAAGRVRNLVTTRSRGNPFYLVHLTHDIQERAPTTALEMLLQTDAVPEGIREFVERRVRHLPAPCDRVLAAAAVLGDEFDFHRLRGVLEGCCTPEAMVIGLDAAEAAGLVESADRDGQRFRFSHPLIGETLRADLPRSERVRLLLRAIDAAEADRAAGSDGCSDELYHYATLARPLVDPEVLARYALEAGRNALGRYSPDRALEAFTTGLSALPHRAVGELAAALHDGAAEARIRISLFNDPETDAHMVAALDFSANAGSMEATVRILSQPFVFRSPEIFRHCLLALERIGNSDPVARGHVLASYGASLLWNRVDDERGSNALAEAVRIAEREGDRWLELRGLLLWAYPNHQAGRFDEARHLLERIIALSGHRVSDEMECLARYLLLDLHTRFGEPEEAERELVRMRERTDAIGDCRWGSIAGWLTARQHLSRGAWDEVRALFAEWAYRVPGAPLLVWLLYILLAETFSGDLAAAKIRADEITRIVAERSGKELEWTVFGVHALVLYSVYTGDQGFLRGCEATARDFLESPLSGVRLRAIGRECLGLCAVIRGDLPSVREHLTAQEPELTDFGPETMGLMTRALGELPEAARHFREALTIRSSKVPECIWIRFFLGESLASQARKEERDEAERCFEAAEQSAIEYRMPVLAAKARAALDSLRYIRRPGPDGRLTPRETEVFRLLAQGRTDKEIAGELFLSTKTVSNHVGSILRKTGAGNRTEAALLARRLERT